MKLLVLNGPNLNLLGIREPALYGNSTYDDLCAFIRRVVAELPAFSAVEIRQSNHEGDLVDWIQQARGVYDRIVINAAAYTHTSVAILDALKAVGIPAAEVHLTEPNAREAFRHVSYVGQACCRRFAGRGFDSYADAIRFFAEESATSEN